MYEAVRTDMRLVPPSTSSCDHAREQLSAQLDHELSEFDRLRLDAHLASCMSCRSFVAQLEATTSALRAAPLEEAHFTIAVPRRRFVYVRSFQAGAAAVAVALVAALSTTSGLTTRQSAGPVSHISPYAVDRGDELTPGHVPRLHPRRLGERLAL